MNHPAPREDPADLFIVEELSRVPAGFPSPAQDHAQRRINLNDVLVLSYTTECEGCPPQGSKRAFAALNFLATHRTRQP